MIIIVKLLSKRASMMKVDDVLRSEVLDNIMRVPKLGHCVLRQKISSFTLHHRCRILIPMILIRFIDLSAEVHQRLVERRAWTYRIKRELIVRHNL